MTTATLAAGLFAPTDAAGTTRPRASAANARTKRTCLNMDPSSCSDASLSLTAGYPGDRDRNSGSRGGASAPTADLTVRICASHVPPGALISTVSPSTCPTSARPSGESGDAVPGPAHARDLDLHAAAVLVFDLDDRADADLARLQRRLVDEHGVVESRAQRPDARLEQALLVLGGVVLEVLREVAVLSRCLDRQNDRLTARALELRELGRELRALGRGQLVCLRLVHRPNHRRTSDTVVACTA